MGMPLPPPWRGVMPRGFSVEMFCCVLIKLFLSFANSTNYGGFSNSYSSVRLNRELSILFCLSCFFFHAFLSFVPKLHILMGLDSNVISWQLS